MAQATGLVFGEAIFDPTLILSHLDHPIVALVVSIGLIIATMTTNIAANIIAPANGFSNLSPKKISYAAGVIITGVLALLFQPWYLLGEAATLFFFFIGTYGGILGPLAAIFIADYYMVKQRRLDVVALFQGEKGRYWYSNGFNSKAIIAWIAGFFLPTLGTVVGFFGDEGAFLRWVNANAYIFSFVVALVVYIAIMDKGHSSFLTAEEEQSMTLSI
jgi:NCS1 family nucleobase:cation symporter-1